MNNNLSRCVTELRALAGMHSEAAEYDAGFDAGEFSGPAHAEMEAREALAILKKYGFTWRSLAEELKERGVSSKWVYFNVPRPEDPYENDSVHGRNANK